MGEPVPGLQFAFEPIYAAHRNEEGIRSHPSGARPGGFMAGPVRTGQD